MRSESAILKSKAVFSDDGQHRFLLRKEWDKDKKNATVIMINPNSADLVNLDLTTMLVINNLCKLGFGSVNIVNLYSRITDKINFRFSSDEDLLLPDNDGNILTYAAKSDAVIIAWGSVAIHSQRIRNRQIELLDKLRNCNVELYKIGVEGYHPLTPAVRNNWDLVPYEWSENYEKSKES